MFKNLSGFKKTKEDKDKVEMTHEKGHKMIIALKPLSATHREQIKRLPLHKMAEGGKIKKYADGDEVIPADYGQNSTPEVQDYSS